MALMEKSRRARSASTSPGPTDGRAPGRLYRSERSVARSTARRPKRSFTVPNAERAPTVAPTAAASAGASSRAGAADARSRSVTVRSSSASRTAPPTSQRRAPAAFAATPSSRSKARSDAANARSSGTVGIGQPTSLCWGTGGVPAVAWPSKYQQTATKRRELVEIVPEWRSASTRRLHEFTSGGGTDFSKLRHFEPLCAISSWSGRASPARGGETAARHAPVVLVRRHGDPCPLEDGPPTTPVPWRARRDESAALGRGLSVAPSLTLPR